MSNPSRINRTVVVVAALLAVTAIAAQAGTPVRLTDVTGPGTLPSNSNAFVASGGFVYFRAEDPDHGSEIWRSDGMPEGTVRLTDALPGPKPPQGEPSELSPIAAVGDTVFFRGWDAAHGWELWRTDNSPTGARLVRDVVPGPMDGYPRLLAATPGRVFFVANGRYTGTELFVSDGTEGGTVLVASGLQNPVRIVTLGERAFVLNAANGQYIWWVSDGTAGGTGPLENAAAVEPWTMRGETTAFAGGFIYFTSCSAASGCEVWRSDGTVAGTTRFTDLVPPGSGYQPPTVQVAGVTTTTLFVDIWPNGPYGGYGALWAVDLTTRLATKLADSPLYLRETVAVGNVLYYRAPHTDATGWELGRSDGTPAGTQVLDLVPGPASSYVYPIGQAGGRLFLRGETSTWVNGQSTAEAWLWSSDGTVAGSTRVLALVPTTAEPGGNFSGGVDLGGRYVFGASELSGRAGIEPWISDGTVAGTRSLGDLNAEPRGADPAEMTANGSRIVFRGCDTEHGCEVWASDGTPGGTALAADVTAGPTSSYPLDFTVFDGAVYFRCQSGYRLCRFDGTTAQEITVGEYSLPEPYYLTVAGDSLYFTARDHSTGRELWRIAPGGSPALVKDIDRGFTQSMGPLFLTPAGDRLYFAAYDYQIGQAVWKTDGSEAGTQPLKSVASSYTNPYYLTAVGPQVFFYAHQPATGAELFKADDASTGIVLVKDIATGFGTQYPGYPDSSAPQKLTAAGNRLFFAAFTPETGRELWTSDGTADGTRLVRDIVDETWSTGAGDSLSPVQFGAATAVGNELYFTTWEPETGVELWRSDGREDGTGVVADIVHKGDALPADLTPYRNTLFFSAWDGRNGRELWQTDGRERSTVRVTDVAEGEHSSSPTELAVVGNQLLFSARDGITGRELWRLPLPDVVLPVISVPEGGAATVTPSIVDPEGTGLSFAWDLDDDGTWDHGALGPSATLSTAGLDGPTTRGIAVRVTDATGVMAIDRRLVTIANAAPLVAVTPTSTEAAPNQVVALSVVVSDPGPDTWTARVEWGDGVVADLGATSATFAASHAWTAEGVFSVTVTVTDDDGGVGNATALVTIGTPKSLIEDLIGDVEDLIDEGDLTNSEGRNLISWLQYSLWMLRWANGERQAIIGVDLFIQKVRSYVTSGLLEPEVGDALIAKAEAILAALRAKL